MRARVLSLLLLICAAHVLRAQRWSGETILNYVYTTPLGSMKNTIKRGNGLTITLGAITPTRRFAFGIDLSYTQYGSDKTKQQYDLEDGTTAKMQVNVSNSFGNYLVYGRWFVIAKGKFLPYLSVKTGYSSFRTDLNIYDPDDWDHCEPLESDLLQRDGTLIGIIGGGFQLDLSAFFGRMKPDRFYLDFSSNVTHGGTVKYMNADAPSNFSGNNSPSDVYATFLNTETRVIHEHHVGYLYSTPVQLLDFKLGFSFRINP